MRAARQSGNSTLSLSETLVGNARARPVHTRCTRCTACNARATHVHVRFRQAAGEPGERERGLRVARNLHRCRSDSCPLGLIDAARDAFSGQARRHRSSQRHVVAPRVRLPPSVSCHCWPD